MTKNKAMSAESAHQGFFETYNNLEANRMQQKLLLEPKFLEVSHNVIKRILEEKWQSFETGIWQSTISPRHQKFPHKICRLLEKQIRGYKSVKAACPILSELSNLEKKLKTENSSDSEKQTLCNRVERLVEKLNEF